MSRLMVTVAAGRRQCKTRTTGGAHGGQPLDLDFPPPRPAGRSGRTWQSRRGGAPAVAGRDPAAPARPRAARPGAACGSRSPGRPPGTEGEPA
jgi:hypothetical protein